MYHKLIRGIFLLSDSSSNKIFTLHKDKRKIFCTNIRDIASERHFYTIKNSENQYLGEY